MNTFTKLNQAVVCSIATCAIAAPALAGGSRATPITPGELPPSNLHGWAFPGWDTQQFTHEGFNGGMVSVEPHSDGLEPPMLFDLVTPPIPLPPLGDTAPVGLDRTNRDRPGAGVRVTAFSTPATGGTVSAVPAPGSAVLLIGAAGAAALRRRRR
ncbi:MAG: PEP-CTERM sorting domain-containing protein [Phycisphaerales bacterium]|nr:PEP-CTERM sorting domain-containing protein [Phycisphaerales bacterium]